MKDHLKNILGWKTKRKLLVISVDDYGNVGVDSKAARDKMDKAGLKIKSRFDVYDSLESTDDLHMLYDVLTSVKDKNDRHAVFTPFALPCNINFEKVGQENEYFYEYLPETYGKLEAIHKDAYKGAWNLWKEGIKAKLMAPQFHGREHFNLKLFKEKLKNGDQDLITALENRSNVSISGNGKVNYAAAFDFWDFNENHEFAEIIEDGLNAFEKVYGYRAVQFNPPAGREHPIIHKYLAANGIAYSDTPFIKQEHQGNGKYLKKINFTGKRNKAGLIYQVRNVLFEPTDPNKNDWVNYSLKQIEIAFKWKKPAIISSHRVNFSGFIDKNNRKIGLSALKELLNQIVKRWPDVEFISSAELGAIIENK